MADSNWMRSSRAGRVTQEAIDECARVRNHVISSAKDECWFCGFKFTDPIEISIRRNQLRRDTLKAV